MSQGNGNVDRALHYRNKAEEVLAIAETIRSKANKEFLVGVASDYYRMAESLERMMGDIVFIPKPR